MKMVEVRRGNDGIEQVDEWCLEVVHHSYCLVQDYVKSSPGTEEAGRAGYQIDVQNILRCIKLT
jgi:hypothetical protein